MGRYRLSLGTFDDGSVLAFPVRGRNVLIAGDPQSGKSWVAGLASEQMILQGYSVCVIDPEGDYQTLEPLPGVVVLGGGSQPPELLHVAQSVRHPDMSVVIDLSHVPRPEKVKYLYTLLPTLAAIRRTTGLPHRIVVDEAHYFLHEPNIRELLDFNLGAYTFVTYHLTDLHPDVRNAMEVLVVKRISDPQEIQTLVGLVGDKRVESEWKSILESLTISQAALLPSAQEAQGRLRRFELFPRLTSHVRHKAKYLNVRLIEEQAFVFTGDDGKCVGMPARTLREFTSFLKACPANVLGNHARREDFSRWIEGVFHDHLLASDMRNVEHRYTVGHERSLADSLVKTIHDRYEFSSSDSATGATRDDARQTPEPILAASQSK
jgi:hypothetical protein